MIVSVVCKPICSWRSVNPYNESIDANCCITYFSELSASYAYILSALAIVIPLTDYWWALETAACNYFILSRKMFSFF